MGEELSVYCFESLFLKLENQKLRLVVYCDHLQFVCSKGRLQGRWVVDEEHGPPEWQCGYTLAPVFWQICCRTLERW